MTDVRQEQPEQRKKKLPPGNRFRDYDHSSEQEHRTAEQFKWKRETVLNVLITFFTLGTVVFAGLAYRETHRQTDIAQKALVAANRAWVEITSFDLDGPIHININGMKFGFKFTLKNVGHSPAIMAWADISIIPYNIAESLIAQKAQCERRRKNAPPTDGITIFPDASAFMNPEVYLYWQYIEHRPEISPAVIGCIDYIFAGSLEHHQTGFIWQIGQVGNSKNEVTAVSTPTLGSPDIPVSVFRLLRGPGTGFYAD